MSIYAVNPGVPYVVFACATSCKPSVCILVTACIHIATLLSILHPYRLGCSLGLEEEAGAANYICLDIVHSCSSKVSFWYNTFLLLICNIVVVVCTRLSEMATPTRHCERAVCTSQSLDVPLLGRAGGRDEKGQLKSGGVVWYAHPSSAVWERRGKKK